MAFSTYLLDAHLAQQKIDNEVTRKDLLTKALQWLRENGAKYGINEGYVFGSVTKAEGYHKQSDIDLAVNSLKVGQPFALMSALSMYLDREVDLVTLDQCHFADKIRHQGIAWNLDDSLV